ncbi:MAG: hypothetical protein FIA99_14220 [Ruminiclostridium sp.]|nr:hypothetical protein [Ruminiclostridium sp.]
MKFNLNKFSIILGFLLAISVGLNIATALTDSVEPGSEQDPLISKSYVDVEVTSLKQQLEDQKKQIDELKNQLQSGGSGGFIVQILEIGQTLLPGGGTELILRSGKATGVSGVNGDNLADVTSAKDLVKGASVVINHLLISSRDDGRGIKATTKSYLLLRGAFKISEPPQDESSIEQPADNSDGSGTPAENELQKGKVNASALNVRSKPSTTAAILAKVYNGEIISVLSGQGDWLNIKTAAGVKGWVLAQYVTMQ